MFSPVTIFFSDIVGYAPRTPLSSPGLSPLTLAFFSLFYALFTRLRLQAFTIYPYPHPPCPLQVHGPVRGAPSGESHAHAGQARAHDGPHGHPHWLTKRTRSLFPHVLLNINIITIIIGPTPSSRGLHRLYTAFDALAEKHQLFKVETIGDAFMCCGGIPRFQPDHALRVRYGRYGEIRRDTERCAAMCIGSRE